MGKVYSKEVRDTVVNARKSGMKIKEICRKFHVCDQTIRDWMREDVNVVGQTSIRKVSKEINVPLHVQRINGKFSEETRREVVKSYRDGQGIADICRKVGIGRSTLYRWITLHTEFRRYAGETFTSKDVYILREENRMLREENLVFQRCACHPGDSLSIKMTEMAKWRDEFSIHTLCRAMNVKRATFYNYLFRKKPQTIYEKNDEALRPHIREIFEESKERFGANKIRIKLMERGFKVSHKHISRLMNEMELICKQQKLRCFNTTNRSYRFRRNRIMQNFDQTAPNVVWVSDITYARVNEDFYAICVIIDLFSRKVIAHMISSNNDTALVLETFKIAYNGRGKPQGLLFHSDQGAQYSAYKFRKYLRDLGVKQSFSNPGTPYDNAVAESFFSMMKQEEISHNYYHREEELEATVADYINFFNTMRPHRKLGGRSPDEFEKLFLVKHPSETLNIPAQNVRTPSDSTFDLGNLG